MIALDVDSRVMEMGALTIMQVILCVIAAAQNKIFTISTIKNFAQSVFLIGSKK